MTPLLYVLHTPLPLYVEGTILKNKDLQPPPLSKNKCKLFAMGDITLNT